MKRKPNLFEKILRKILIITDKYFRGLDFLKVHDPAEFNFDNKVIFKNSPSGGSYLLNALRDLNIKDNQKIIDIGCGKGSAINTMRRLPFSEICGIEIVSYFSDIAKKNFKKLKVKNVKIINIDARKFDNYGNYNFIYLYNPFSLKILNSVMKKIDRQCSKKTKIIYNNPVGHQIILKHKFFLTKVYEDQWGNNINLYEKYRD